MRYRVDSEGYLVDRDTGERLVMPDRVVSPMIVRDISYKSPLSGKEITSRSQRREEMKVHQVREVDPSERKGKDIYYHNKKYAESAGRDWQPKPKPDLGEGYHRLSKDELPSRLTKKLA